MSTSIYIHALVYRHAKFEYDSLNIVKRYMIKICVTLNEGQGQY